MAGASRNPAPSMQRDAPRPRRKSLRNVKDSTEDLQRRLRQADSGVSDSMRAGRSNFTVSNIGNNGLIYLRPVSRGDLHPPAIPHNPAMPDVVVSQDEASDGPSGLSHEAMPNGPGYALESSTILQLDPSRRQLRRDSAAEEDLQSPTNSRYLSTLLVPGSSQTGLSIGKATSLEHQPATDRLDWLDLPLSNLESHQTRDSFLDDVSSSTISREEYHSIFPAPPARKNVVLGGAIGYPVTGAMEAQPSSYERELFEASMSETSSSVVRMSSATGDIVAASLSRLIAQITSPDLLDYVMLSDFFLTYRSFLSPDDLLTRLFARMRWAVNRPDAFGRKVRVRTFVAIRHWVLNYFVEDFVSDSSLRGRFCDLANALDKDLREREDGGGGDLKIIMELKKCWRSTCALYWDIPLDRTSANEAIFPGGEVGSRHGMFDTYEPGAKAVLQPAKGDSIIFPATEERHSMEDRHKHTSRNSMHNSLLVRAAAPPLPKATDPDMTSKPNRESSLIYSCSIPKAVFERGKPIEDRILGPHPVRSQARDVKTTSSVPIKPAHQHQRSISGERGPLPLSKPVEQKGQAALTRQIPGCLIRGVAYEPLLPYIETFRPSSPVEGELAGGFEPEELRGDSPTATAANPSVKKLIGSVRRAFSVKGNDPRPFNGLERARSVHQASAAHPVPRDGPQRSLSPNQKKQFIVARTEHRIDLLAAKALETFRKVLEERKYNIKPHRADSQRSSRSAPGRLRPTAPQHGDRVDSHVTQGSRSIVIFDDTGSTAANISGRRKENRSEIPTPRRSVAAISGSPAKSGVRSNLKPGTAKTAVTTVGSAKQTPPRYLTPPYSSIPAPRFTPRGDVPAATPRAYRSMIPLPSSSPASRNLPTSSISPKPGASVREGKESLPDAVAGSKESPVSSSRGVSNVSKLPIRQVRRQPGRDLRQVENTQSLATPKNAPPSSSASEIKIGTKLPQRPAGAGTTAMATATSLAASEAMKKAFSMVSTRSSQQNLRPSFEAEVAKLAQLPDDNDGGIESTLLKLEGRYSKTPTTPTRVDPAMDSERSNTEDSPMQTPFNTDPNDEAVSSSDQAQAFARSRNGGSLPSRVPRTKSPSPSEQSFSSVPLLERVSNNTASRRRKSPSEWLQALIPPKQSGTGIENLEDSTGPKVKTSQSEGSLVVVEKTRSMQNIAHEVTMPTTSSKNRSVYEDDTHSVISVSSESDSYDSRVNRDGSSVGIASFYNESITAINDEPFLLHPLRHPETPPSAQGLTPGLKPDQRRNIMISQGSATLRSPLGINIATKGTAKRDPPTRAKSAYELRESEDIAVLPPVAPLAHLPFIMGHDSLQLAQQLTLIERDALAEIEWRDLIELRWSQIVPPVRDWVQYLTANSKTKSADPPFHGGVDLVVTRFNLMFKWALSEIVMTDDIYERAACITKLIRIAQHCRRLHNWATMCQIIMALVSSDCSRLIKTWALVSDSNRRALSELETLITPMRNFANLRAEVDAAPSIATDGCIPFLGIYTHDLIYNAQKPAYIDNETSSEPLINFERHHTAASIVKGLLTLIEASSKYSFKPCGELLSRCLWVAALSDDEIARKSRALEA